MDPDMIRPRKCKPCPPPPPPPSPPKKEAPPPPPPPPHGENVVQACQHDCCNFQGHPLSPSLWPCHPPPQNYWNDDMDRFSRMQRVESHEMGYRMNFRDPLDDFHEDHTLRRRCMALQPPSARYHRHGPPPMLMGHHRGQMGHHRGQLGHHHGQPPPLLGHHREPPTSYFPPPGDYGYQQYGYYDNPNGCTIM